MNSTHTFSNFFFSPPKKKKKKREVIPITLSDTFLIAIPVDSSNVVDGCGQNVAQCVSGDILTDIFDNNGCEVGEGGGKRDLSSFISLCVHFFFHLVFYYYQFFYFLFCRYLRKREPRLSVNVHT